MTVLIFGLGVGLLTIICLWAVSFLLCILSYRTQKSFGPASIIVSLIITVILLTIPREPENQDDPATIEVFDNFFFWRISIIIFLALSALSGFICYFFSDLMVPCHARPVKQWRL